MINISPVALYSGPSSRQQQQQQHQQSRSDSQPGQRLNGATQQGTRLVNDHAETAVARLTDLLKTPDDLDKIDALIERFTRERAALDAQLNVAIQAQLDIIQSGLGAITTAQNDMVNIKQEMEKLDKTCTDTQSLVRDFATIDTISKCHINFANTLEMVEHLESMGETLENLRQQLDQDRESAEAQANSRNLLPMHFQLSKLLDFRDQALRQAVKARKDVQETLRRYFIPLDKFEREFEEHLFMLSSILLDILRTGDPSVVVRVCKIIYMEDQQDKRAQALEQASKTSARSTNQQRSTSSGNTGSWSASASSAADNSIIKRFGAFANTGRQSRDYKAKFLSAIERAVKADFQGCAESFNEPLEMLDNLEWIFQDLTLVQEELVKRTPPEWGMFDVFVGFYHSNLSDLLNKVVKLEPDGQTILKLLEWVKLYNSTMKAELGVDVKNLEPKLLDGRENELVEDYLKLIVRKLEEWMSSLEKTETKSFVERTESPEESPEGIYGMQGAVIMFQMVSQQIDVAADSGQGRVLASVVSECDRVMAKTREHWQQMLEHEVSLVKSSRERLAQSTNSNRSGGDQSGVDEPPPGLTDYIMALANDQIRAADYCEAISARLSPLVSAKYGKPIVDALSSSTDGFLDLAKSCLSQLVELISLDVRAAFDTLFTKAWYDDSHAGAMKLICNTYAEYLEDVQAHLTPDLRGVFVEALLESFIADYISAMASNKKATYKPPACFDLITEEISEAIRLFNAHMEMDLLQQQFDVLDLCIAILQVDSNTIDEDYAKLKQLCPDVPNWVVEGILSRRDDLGKKEVKSLMDQVRQTALALQSNPHALDPANSSTGSTTNNTVGASATATSGDSGIAGVQTVMSKVRKQS
ncbi:SNARE-binding exocyst subunit S6 [Savitreella phatthalungensis]